jgi:hypothetical protein
MPTGNHQGSNDVGNAPFLKGFLAGVILARFNRHMLLGSEPPSHPAPDRMRPTPSMPCLLASNARVNTFVRRVRRVGEGGIPVSLHGMRCAMARGATAPPRFS